MSNQHFILGTVCSRKWGVVFSPCRNYKMTSARIPNIYHDHTSSHIRLELDIGLQETHENVRCLISDSDLQVFPMGNTSIFRVFPTQAKVGMGLMARIWFPHHPWKNISQGS